MLRFHTVLSFALDTVDNFTATNVLPGAPAKREVLAVWNLALSGVLP